MTIDFTKPFRRLAPSAQPEIDTETGRATFIFNTEDVGRDGHIVRNAGIRTENYQANPTILFAHDDSQPPVGRATAVRIGSPASKVEIEFPSADLYPFGATIGALVKARYLNACSMSWQPLKWHFRDAKDRTGGVVFDEVDLLEISIVPVPALPEAIATARSHGIDTGPLYEWAERLLDTGGRVLVPRDELETLRRAAKMPTQRAESAEWKVGASRELPIEDSDAWDGPAAAKSIFEYAGGDEFSSEKARKGFLVYDAAKPQERGSYKLPIAHSVDGELKVPKGALRAAASRLPQTDIPDDVKKRAQAVLEHYEEKAGVGDKSEQDETERAAKAARRAAAIPLQRGLWDVAQVACILAQYGCLHAMAVEEAAREGDESAVPGVMLDALETMVEAFKAHAAEEADELLGDAKGSDDDDDLPPEGRAFIAAGKTAYSRAIRRGIAMARAGKVLSASNEKRLKDAEAHHGRAMKHHRTTVEHQKAVAVHLEDAQSQHERASKSLADASEHARAAKEKGEAEQIERCMRSLRAAAEQMGAVAEAHQSAHDAHEDAVGSHEALGRSVKRAQHAVHSVLGAQSAETDEKDEKDQAERAARERLAKAIRIRGASAA